MRTDSTPTAPHKSPRPTRKDTPTTPHKPPRPVRKDGGLFGEVGEGCGPYRTPSHASRMVGLGPSRTSQGWGFVSSRNTKGGPLLRQHEGPRSRVTGPDGGLEDLPNLGE